MRIHTKIRLVRKTQGTLQDNKSDNQNYGEVTLESKQNRIKTKTEENLTRRLITNWKVQEAWEIIRSEKIIPHASEPNQRRRRPQRERQKTNRFRLAQNNNCRASRFFGHFYNVKVPNFTFCLGREHKTTIFFFLSWTLIQSLRIKLQRNLPTFDELNEME